MPQKSKMFQLLVGNNKATRERSSRVADFKIYYFKVPKWLFEIIDGFIVRYSVFVKRHKSRK